MPRTIDLNLLLEYVLRYKVKLLLIVSGFVLAGVIYILVTPKSYQAETLLLPESENSSGLGGIGQLASSIPGLGGLNLGKAGADAIRPQFYPMIVQSTPFLRKFIDYTFYHPDFQDSVTILTYSQKYAPTNPWSLLKRYTIGLPGELIAAARNFGDEKKDSTNIIGSPKEGDSMFRPTVWEYKYMRAIGDVVSVSVDKNTGVIRVSVQNSNPVVAAYLTEFTKDYLVSYVTDYRRDKQLNQVNFLAERNTELEEKFLKDQAALAAFKERNFNISSSYLQNQLENLTSSYELSKNLYFSVNAQLEQAEIKLNEETPIFAVVEPVSVPAIKSKPQSLLVLFLTGSLGILVAAIFVLLQLPKERASTVD